MKIKYSTVVPLTIILLIALFFATNSCNIPAPPPPPVTHDGRLFYGNDGRFYIAKEHREHSDFYELIEVFPDTAFTKISFPCN